MDSQVLLGTALLGVIGWLCITLIKNTVAIGLLSENLKSLHERLEVLDDIENEVSSLKTHIRAKELNGHLL